MTKSTCPYQRKARPDAPDCYCCGLGVLKKLRPACPYWRARRALLNARNHAKVIVSGMTLEELVDEALTPDPSPGGRTTRKGD